MTAASGAKLDAALTDLGWRDMLDEIPDIAIPLVFQLLGETGAQAPVLNDVVLHAAGDRRRTHHCRCHSRAAPGWCGSAATVPSSALDEECRYILCTGRSTAHSGACRRPAGTGLVAGRHQQGHALAGAPARGGPRPIRPPHQLIPGDPAPAGRDTRRDRGRRGDPANRRGCRRKTPTAWPACWQRPRPARRR